jgi:hypothetical protein
MGQPWGRLYTGTRNHRKFTAIRRKHKDTWTYLYVLLECSFEADDEGKIYVNPGLPYSIEELADEIHFHKSPKFLQDLIETSVKVGLISYENQVPQWLSYSKRQFKSDRNGAERVQKYREKRYKGKWVEDECNVTETLQGNTPETAKRQNRTEHINNPPTPQKGGSRKAKENGSIPYEEIREAWNQFKPPLLPTTIALNGTRKNLIKQAWMEHPSLEWFREFFADINLSDHHSGRNDKNWIPEIDWILKNRLKLQEKIEAVKGRGQTKNEMDNYMDFLADRDGVTQ